MRRKVFVILLAFLLVSCNSRKEKNYDYKYFENYSIEWNDILNQKYDKYFVYFYSNYCHNCNEIKQEIFNFADKKIFPIYFCESGLDVKICDNEETIICIYGTPSMFLIENHMLKSRYSGKQEVLEVINEIELFLFEI